MNLQSVVFCALVAFALAKDCPNLKRINSKLICYYSQTTEIDSCYCTHVVLPANTDVKEIDSLRKRLNGVKILLTVNEFNQGLVDTVKQNSIDGLELNLKNLKSKDDITDFISTVRTKLGTDLFLALSIPPKTELLAKYYDLKALTKTTDLFILQTSFLGASKNATFHPSRLSGVWDMQNTDSVVDLVTGLGAPLSRLVVTAPVQAFQFRLQDSSLTTPGSPALEVKTISRKEFCKLMKDQKEQEWTLERDQDQAGPYVFRGTDWIAFEDLTSLDIKAKYTRVRGLAGLALKDLSQDLPSKSSESSDDTFCGSLLVAAHAGLTKQNRAPRAAVLRSLEREILETPGAGFGVGYEGQGINVSPFRITRVVDVEGHVHSVRKDTRTEFTCSRQGYFVHPQSCGRFYRCVKFDQLTDEFSVFEFDCPAGLAFDERVEVCVWPGSLPHGAPCQGSSEIAPVPRGRFKCPSQQGYYVDPENCRWFFACLDHGQSEMTAYEFRCPFGLVFDEQHLLCQWPWLVPSCGNGHGTGLELDSIEYYGGASRSTLIGTQNNHLKGGIQVLDSYDGLGSLGNVVLGGYQGDINIYKNSLQSHGLESANLNIGNIQFSSGNEQGFLSAQHGQYDFKNEENVQNVGLNSNSASGGILTNIAFDNSNGNAAQSYSHYEGTSGANSASNYDSINLNSEGRLYGLNSGLDSQGKLGVIHFGTAVNGDSGSTIQHGLSDSEISFGILGDKQESLVNIQESSGSNLGSKLTSGDYENSGYYGRGSAIQNGLSSSEINLGLLADKQESLVNIQESSGFNLGSKLTSGDYGNSGYYEQGQKIALTNSGVQSGGIATGAAKLATSSIDYNNYNQGKQESGLFEAAEKYQGYNDKLVLTAYKTQAPQQTVLLDSGAKSINYNTGDQLGTLNNAKSSFYNNQYYGSYGNTQGTILANNNAYLVDSDSKSGTSFQSIQHSHPVQSQKVVTVQTTPLQSTVQFGQDHSGTLNYNYQYANEAQYIQKPIGHSGTSYSTVSFGTTKLKHIGENQTPQFVSYAPKYYAVTPKTEIFNFKPNYQYQTPVVQPVQKLRTEGAKSHSFSTIEHYQTPVVQFEQKVQPLVHEQKVQPLIYEQKVQQPIIYEQKIEQQKVLSEGEKSHSYSTIQHYQNPVTRLEQTVQQPILYEQKVQPAVQIQYEQKVQPAVQIQYEQKVQPIVQYEQKLQPLQQVYNTESAGAKSHSYSSVNHYHSPAVQYEQKVEQPVLVQQQVEVKSPVVHQEVLLQKEIKTPVVPVVAKQQSYSSGYHYQSPVVHYEQKVQPVIQQVQYEQKIQPEINLESKSQSQFYGIQHNIATQEIKTPVVQQEILLPKVQSVVVSTPRYEKIEIVPQIKQTAYSTSFLKHEQQYEQKVQPVVYEQQVQQPIVHYEHQIEQPVVYEQKVQQPVVYEQKIQQPVVYEQKVQQPIVYKQEVQQPVVYEQKVRQPIFYKQEVQQPVVYEQKVQQPVVYEQKVQQPVVYDQKVQQPIVYKQEVQQPVLYEQKVQQPIVYEQKIQQPVVYEQKVQQPIVYKQEVQPLVYKSESENAKSHSFSQIHHYQSPVVQYEQKVEQPVLVQQNVQIKTPVVQPVQHITVTPKYESVSVTPQYETRYQEINIPVVKQQPAPFVSKVNIPVETVSVTPKYKSNSYISFNYKAVAPKFETQYFANPVQPVTYEAKVPVIEPKFVQKIVQPLYTQPAPPSKVETVYYGKQVEHQTVTAAPQIINTYLPVKQEVKEYLPPKPTINTVYVSSTSKPDVKNYYVSPSPQPKVYVSSTPRYSVFQEFAQPKQTYEIRKTVQPITYQTINIETPVQTPAPAVVQTYNYSPPKVETKQYLPPVTTSRAYLPAKLPQVVSTTPKYDVFQEFIQPKQTYEIKKPSPTVVSEYQYENPEYKHYESKLNFNSAQDLSYEYKPVELNVQSDVYYSPQKPIKTVPIKTYQTDYILSTPKPNFVSTIAPIVKQTPTLRTKVVAINKFETEDNRYYVSTPKPIYVSTPAPIIAKTEVPLGEYRYYDSRYDTATGKTVDSSSQYLKETFDNLNQYENIEFYDTTPKVKIVTSTARPIIQRKKIVSTTRIPLDNYQEYYDDKLNYHYTDSRYDTSTKRILASNQYLKETSDILNEFGNSEYYETTPKVKIVTSTARPIQRKKIVSTTTQIPSETYQEYYDDKFDSQYIVTNKPTYRPQIHEDYVATTLRPLRKKITTSLPIYDENYNNDYVITTRPKIASTTRPVVVKKKKIITTSAPSIDYEEYLISTNKPSIKITPRPKSKTIVKVNDFHPFITSKLGAQCTCSSNIVKLRKSKQKEEVIDYDFELPDNVPVTKITSSGPASYDDYNEPGVYVVGNSESYDYDYEPKKLVAVTKSPEVLIKSTTNQIQPAPTPMYSIRKKVTTIRPESSSFAPEIILSSTPATQIIDEVFVRRSKSKEQKIAEAVNEGLSLVKSAIKGYVKDAVQEEVRNLDRYGHGGWRSRDETLQGSVDCQRPGLFRHPTQCNKFYACRWDCTKQRYTLHVFNCPVHLTFDTSQGACNWPSKGPACTDNTLLPSA